MSMNDLVCKWCLDDMSFNTDIMGFECKCGSIFPYNMSMGMIIAIGLELEGGWDSFPSGEIYHYSTHDDSSVEIDDIYDQDCGDCDGCGDDSGCTERNCDSWSGELVSKVIPLSQQGDEDIPLWQSWVKHCYPEYHNTSCGGHFHLSFEKIRDYENLCCGEFNDYFIRELKSWGNRANIRNDDFWSRVDGNNSMCSTIFRGAEQINVNGGDNYPECRYTALNFQYQKHGTLEVRVLPIFDNYKTYISAVKACIRIINGWLKKMSKQQITIETENITYDFGGNVTSTMIRELELEN